MVYIKFAINCINEQILITLLHIDHVFQFVPKYYYYYYYYYLWGGTESLGICSSP
jgi:hypothetical protein